MIRRFITRFLREEDGVALVLALAAMTILAITTTGVIVGGTANEDTAYVAVEGRSAFGAAQLALAYGEGMVYGDIGSSPVVFPSTSTQNIPTQPGGATGTYTASTLDYLTWHIVATGTSGGVTRTVSADVTPQQTVTSQGYSLWTYLYENSSNPTCISGGTVVTEPIYAKGNLCLSGGTTKVLTTLEVGGNLTTSGGSQIGSAASPIPKLAIGGTCAVNGPAKPAGTTPCDGSHNSTYANTVTGTLDPDPGMPSVNFAAAYSTQAALTQTGCPAGLFETTTGPSSTKLDDSVANVATVLFQAAAYDCKVGTNEIKWSGTGTKQLTLNGTFYFDGSMNDNLVGVVYSGLGSLYFSGGFAMSAGATLCGIASCTTSWDTRHNVMVVVTECLQGPGPGTIPNSCVNLSGGSVAQFGAWVATNYNVSGGSSNMGPVLCDTFTLSGGSAALIPLLAFPVGTPASTTTVQVTGVPPANWSG